VWLRWLESHSWYEGSQNTEDNYSIVLENLLRRETRKQFFLRLLDPNVPASAGYNHLLEILDTGRIRPVTTTAGRGAEARWWPIQPSFAITKRSPAHRIGYHGAEPSIMHHLLLDQSSATNNFRQGVYWCTLSENPDNLQPLVKEFASRIGSNFQSVHIEGFDEVMKSLAEVCASLPRLYSVPIGSMSSDQATVPFDMRVLNDADLDELDWVRAETQMIAYCRRMICFPN
jgi:hypothetical protein